MPDGSGGFITPVTIYGTLTSSASGYAFRDKNGLVHQFNVSGQLTQIVDKNGNALVMAYDASGHLKTRHRGECHGAPVNVHVLGQPHHGGQRRHGPDLVLRL